MRQYKCNYCGERHNEDEVVLVNDIRVGKDCEQDYKYKLKNSENFKKLKEYIEKDILCYDDTEKLNKQMIQRLYGLRKGEPVKNGDTVPFRPNEGTNYEIIRIAFQYKKSDILYAIKNKSFTSEVQKFFYICMIVENNLLDVKKKIKEKIQSQKVLDNVQDKIEIKTEVAYVKEDKVDNKTDVIKKELDELW